MKTAILSFTISTAVFGCTYGASNMRKRVVANVNWPEPINENIEFGRNEARAFEDIYMAEEELMRILGMGSLSFSISLSYSGAATNLRVAVDPKSENNSGTSSGSEDGSGVHILGEELPAVSDTPSSSSAEAASADLVSAEGTTGETKYDAAALEVLGEIGDIRVSDWEKADSGGASGNMAASELEPSGTSSSDSSEVNASDANGSVAENVQLGVTTRDSGIASANTSSAFGPGKTAIVAVASICGTLIIGYLAVWKFAAARAYY